jgi:hypothetical protein
MRCFVYFNLHKKCFSIKALEGAMKGKVIAHRDTVILTSCKLLVSEAGRQRVLREKRKNVHAGVSGTWIENGHEDKDFEQMSMFWDAVTYNPYKYASFVLKASEKPVGLAQVVAMKAVPNAEGIKRGVIYKKDWYVENNDCKV